MNIKGIQEIFLEKIETNPATEYIWTIAKERNSVVAYNVKYIPKVAGMDEEIGGIIFVNVDEGIFQYIRTLDEFKKNVNNFHLGHWSWSDNSDRPVFSITLT